MVPLHLRLAGWYATALGTICMVPFLAVILHDAGLSQRWVAASLMLLPIGTLGGGPVWALIADRTGSPRGVLVASTVGATLGGALLLAAPTGAWMAAALGVYAVARAPMFSIADAIVLRVLPGGRSGYGAVRLWGSLVFLVLAFANGWLREIWPRAPLWVAFFFMLGTVVAAWSLPSPKTPPRPPFLQSLAALRRQPALLPLLGACVLHGVGITTYDSLYSLHVEHLGLGSRVIGQAVAVGVGAEIAVMALSRRALVRLSPVGLLLLGIAASVPRWWLTGTVDSAAAQVALQSLHGFTFGAFWVAGVSLFAEAAPDGLETSTQALLPAATFGGGYLLSMGAAAIALEYVDTPVLFQAISVVSLVATLLAAIAAWQIPRRPHAFPASAPAPTPVEPA